MQIAPSGGGRHGACGSGLRINYVHDAAAPKPREAPRLPRRDPRGTEPPVTRPPRHRAPRDRPRRPGPGPGSRGRRRPPPLCAAASVAAAAIAGAARAAGTPPGPPGAPPDPRPPARLGRRKKLPQDFGVFPQIPGSSLGQVTMEPCPGQPQEALLTVNEQFLGLALTAFRGKAKAASPTPVASSPAPSQPGVTHLAVQATPQVLAQESLATGVTGVMVPAGTVTQPLLIPISIAGQVTGQQALALVTIPTATLAALPGLTPAAPAGAIFKPPVANLTAAAVLSPAVPAVPAVPAPRPPPGQPPLLPQPPPAPTPPKEPPVSVQPQIAGLAFNPGILTAALGTQPQILGSLSAPPVIATPLPSVQGIPGQLLSTTQGQVIGTLPWVVAPPGVAAAAPAPAPPSLQVTAVTPQLLLNAQGQVIATLGATLATGAALATAPPAPAPGKKNGPAEPPIKSEVQPIQPAPAGVGPSPPAVPKVSVPPSPGPVPGSETPTVSQLVAKPPAPPSTEEDGINLEEIREFAKNFKLRRLSLGLTQTQVGQALTATEGPAYSQSAICRFEKLDITPKSAQKLKPVLEKWLREAEQRQREGQQHLLEFVGGEPGKKRKRRTSFTPQALEALNAHFERNALPTGAEITRIAQELRYEREVVRVWFCNRRQTLKNTSKLNVFHVP
ncbi:LOW QUALITY PROTEIN: POU domain, class 6, transcription factor 1 [Molothrus ater]|uniref:LOW QUALITY PROTEIN: POU domain, class 6, transcription factor 1 n=1 Tax=Molothrus ater TaxID=84834 RepID=UPI0023E773FF|nr:LOW QUALITY PROTEIN: POU domain, class 6, transcription factor 1 [Molothrus ater]